MLAQIPSNFGLTMAPPDPSVTGGSVTYGSIWGGGYMTPALVSQAWNSVGGQIKGLMTLSVNGDGSLGWTFGDNVKGLEGR